MLKEGDYSQLCEQESLLGATTLGCARFIVGRDSRIKRVYLRPYFYVPNESLAEKPFRLERNEFLCGQALNEKIRGLEEGWNIAFDSRVEDYEGNEWQLPMMDLHLPKSDENLGRITQRFQQLIIPRFGGGFLLETKRSYQFFGQKLLSQKEYLDFLGSSLLTSIVTVTPEDQPNLHEIVADYRYIGYSLLRRSTGLRITTNGSKTFIPSVVKII